LERFDGQHRIGLSTGEGHDFEARNRGWIASTGERERTKQK